VPAFCEPYLPHGNIGITPLIASFGSARLAGFVAGV